METNEKQEKKVAEPRYNDVAVFQTQSSRSAGVAGLKCHPEIKDSHFSK